jgi:hypothetical protein
MFMGYEEIKHTISEMYFIHNDNNNLIGWMNVERLRGDL